MAVYFVKDDNQMAKEPSVACFGTTAKLVAVADAASTVPVKCALNAARFGKPVSRS